MPLLQLFQVATPTVATQVTNKVTPCRQAIVGNSGANTTSVGDKTMTTAATGVNIPSGTNLPIGTVSGGTSFDLSELYVIAATGNVNVLAVLL